MGKNIKNNINLVHDKLQWSYDQANALRAWPLDINALHVEYITHFYVFPLLCSISLHHDNKTYSVQNK